MKLPSSYPTESDPDILILILYKTKIISLYCPTRSKEKESTQKRIFEKHVPVKETYTVVTKKGHVDFFSRKKFIG